MSEAWMASQSVRALVRYLAERDVPQDRALSVISAGAGGLDDAEAHFPAADYLALLELGARETGDPWFGHHYGATLKPERWGIAGYLAYHCASLGEALEVQQRYQGLVGNIGEPCLQRGDTQTELEWRTSLGGTRHVAEEVLAGWQVFARDVTGTEVRFDEVCLAHPAAADPAEIESFYGCPVRFGTGRNAVRFDNALLRLKFLHPDSVLTETLRQRAESMRAALESVEGPRRELQQYLLQTLPERVPDLEELAARMHVSPRTLQRRMKEWDTTFKAFLDETRRDAALRYLDGGGTNLLEITFLLGFSEQAAFHRAFKRWTKQTPGQYRAARQKSFPD